MLSSESVFQIGQILLLLLSLQDVDVVEGPHSHADYQLLMVFLPSWSIHAGLKKLIVQEHSTL